MRDIMEQYVVLGAGGHAKVVIDILQLTNKEIYGLVDKNNNGMCMNYHIVGSDDLLPEIYKQGICNASMGIGHIGDVTIRNHVYQIAKEIGFKFPTIIHPSAILSDSAILNEGVLCNAGGIVNAGARIGALCILNTSSIVEHDSVIGYGVHLGPNATVLGGASVGDNTFIGAGSIVLQGVHVGSNCTIGAGTVVLHDIPDDVVVVGTPGNIIRRKR